MREVRRVGVRASDSAEIISGREGRSGILVADEGVVVSGSCFG